MQHFWWWCNIHYHILILRTFLHSSYSRKLITSTSWVTIWGFQTSPATTLFRLPFPLTRNSSWVDSSNLWPPPFCTHFFFLKSDASLPGNFSLNFVHFRRPLWYYPDTRDSLKHIVEAAGNPPRIVILRLKKKSCVYLRRQKIHIFPPGWLCGVLPGREEGKSRREREGLQSKLM